MWLLPLPHPALPLRNPSQPDLRSLLGLHGGGGGSMAQDLAPNHGGLETGVAASMLVEVIAAHEALITERTQETLFTRVRACVACQLV